MMSRRDGAHGAFVAVCGPAGLSKDVAHAVRVYDVDFGKAIGGIQFHEECVLSLRIIYLRLTQIFLFARVFGW